MTLQSVPGAPNVQVGINPYLVRTIPVGNSTTIDAANEAVIFIGHVITSDGGSHTLDTSGSSSLGWNTGAITFANGATVLKVGLATVDAGNGPPGRATNVADVITFSVSKSLTGGGGGITGSAWQEHVPDTGSLSVANGDFIAFCVQMTARGGADSVLASSHTASTQINRPAVTDYTGGAYSAKAALPRCIITFSDGALGYFAGGEVHTGGVTARTWNSGSATVEYGQLYNFPFPMKIHGIYGYIAATADCDIVLYSDPLVTPVAVKTVSIDANTVAAATGRLFEVMFASPYSTTANAPIGAVFKPGGSNVSAYYRTLNAASHRASFVWGTSGYGISRASGAFADANSSLDHYYIGLLVGAFEQSMLPYSRIQLGM